MGDDDREETGLRHHRHHHQGRDKDRERSSRHGADEDRHRRKKRRRHEDSERSRRKDDHEKEESNSKSLADEFADMMDDEEKETKDFASNIERESWMTGEQSGDKADPFNSLLGAVREKKPTEKPKTEAFGGSVRELNTRLHTGENEPTSSDLPKEERYIPPKYTIGDEGSSWRMMKLKNLRAAAKEQMRPIEDLAIERMGSLQEYDEAREEEQELERRKRDYKGQGVMKVKITGELYLQRLAKEEKARQREKREEEQYPAQKPSKITADDAIPQITQSDLNRLQAALLRAEMMDSPDVARLTKEYNLAVEKFNTQPSAPEVVILPSQHSALMPHLS